MDKLFQNSLAYYHVRITMDSSLEHIYQVLATYQYTSCLIVSQEDPGRHEHYHALIGLSELKYTNHLRSYIKKTLYVKASQYSVSICKNLKLLKKYVIKEGHYKQLNFNMEELENLQKIAFKKNRKEMLEKLDEMDLRYMQTGDKWQAYDTYCDIKITFGQVVNDKWFIDHIQTINLRDKRFRKKHFNDKIKYCV